MNASAACELAWCGWSASTLDHWQSFAGALIGAGIPILFSLYVAWRQSKREFRREMSGVHAVLVSAVNELHLLQEELESFVLRCDAMIANIANTRNDEYYEPKTNFPVFRVEYGTRLVETKTGSVYLANKLLFCHTMLKHIDTTVVEMRSEFRAGLQHNHERILAAKAAEFSAKTCKDIITAEITSVRNLVKNALVDNNIPIAARALVAANEYLLMYMERPWYTKLIYEGRIAAYWSRGIKPEHIDARMASRVETVLKEISVRYEQQK